MIQIKNSKIMDFKITSYRECIIISTIYLQFVEFYIDLKVNEDSDPQVSLFIGALYD